MFKKKPRVETEAGPFVVAATSITGIDVDNALLKTRMGYFISAIKVRGIDIEGMREEDQESVFSAWGAVEQTCEVPRKIVLCETVPDLSFQLKHLERAIERQHNPALKNLLQRQKAWTEFYAKEQRDQAGFILFFSKSKEEAIEARERYVLRAAPVRISATACNWEDLLLLCRILLAP